MSGAREIGDRAEAIHAAIAVSAGPAMFLSSPAKATRPGQIVGSETRPFSDREEAIKAAIALGGRAAEAAA